MKRHIPILHWWYTIVNNEHVQHREVVFGEQDNSEEFCGFVLWCSRCDPRGLGNEITLTFQKYVILAAKRQSIGSV